MKLICSRRDIKRALPLASPFYVSWRQKNYLTQASNNVFQDPRSFFISISSFPHVCGRQHCRRLYSTSASIRFRFGDKAAFRVARCILLSISMIFWAHYFLALSLRAKITIYNVISSLFAILVVLHLRKIGIFTFQLVALGVVNILGKRIHLSK
jgi:hypothetical protein